MLKYRRMPILILMLCLLANCVPQGSPSGAPFPHRIVAMVEGERPAFSLENANGNELEGVSQKPFIALQYGERLVQVLTTNLDTDEPAEQVIIVGNTRHEASPLLLYIADKNSSLDRYEKAWETELAAVNERTIRIDIIDLIGAQSLQIVVSGMNAAGAVTLDVFRPLSPYGMLSYMPVFRLESEGSIEIVNTDESAGYSGGHRYGASFPIIAYRSNPETEFYSDVIRDTYQYNDASARYELIKTEKIQAESIGESQLDTLFQSTSPEPFKAFIKGLWRKVEEEESGDEKIFAFDPENGEITFYTKGIQEVYRLKFSRRSLYNALTMYTENELLRSIQPNVTAALLSPDELTVAITEYSTMEQWLNDQWGGQYRRLDQSQIQEKQRLGEAVTVFQEPYLQGDYVTANGVMVSFASPAIRWQDGAETRAGGFSIARVPDGESRSDLLMIKFIEEQGLKTTDLFYLIETAGIPAASSSVDSFTLKPAAPGVFSIQRLKAEPLSFSRKQE